MNVDSGEQVLLIQALRSGRRNDRTLPGLVRKSSPCWPSTSHSQYSVLLPMVAVRSYRARSDLHGIADPGRTHVAGSLPLAEEIVVGGLIFESLAADALSQGYPHIWQFGNRFVKRQLCERC